MQARVPSLLVFAPSPWACAACSPRAALNREIGATLRRMAERGQQKKALQDQIASLEAEAGPVEDAKAKAEQ